MYVRIEQPHRLCRYYESAWRRDPEQLPGGFMVDAGVHHMAALRRILAGAQPLRARAVGSSRDDSVTLPDTLLGTIEWDNGMLSSVSMCLPTVQVRGGRAVRLSCNAARHECSLVHSRVCR